MQQVGLASNEVPGDGKQPPGAQAAATEDPDVCAPGRRPGLDRIADDGSLAEAAALRAHIDEQVSGALQLRIVVVFDVVADKLEVPHASALEPDSGHGVVADVA